MDLILARYASRQTDGESVWRDIATHLWEKPDEHILFVAPSDR
jgi:hypothetical protein